MTTRVVGTALRWSRLFCCVFVHSRRVRVLGRAAAAAATTMCEALPRVDGLAAPHPETRRDANDQTHEVLEHEH